MNISYPYFSYHLGDEVQPIITGKKLHSRNIRARQILIKPSKNLSEKYWVVTGVASQEDIDFLGEIFIYVRPRSPLRPHETFVTVDSGIRSGLYGKEVLNFVPSLTALVSRHC